MADPIGNFLGRAFWGVVGYRAGVAREQARETALLERERLKMERQQFRHRAAQLRADQIERMANRVYARLYAKLVGSIIDANHPLFTGQKFPIRDLIGNAALAKFALETAEFVRKELKQQT